jgi:O-antigen ligase
MTAISAQPLDTNLYGVRRRAAWPWLATTMMFISFLFAVHDPYASQKWQTTVQADVNNLAAAEANGNLARQLGCLMMGVIGIALVTRKSRRATRIDPMVLFPFSMIVLWAFSSIAWSADPLLSFKRLTVLGCVLLAMYGMIRQYDFKTQVEMACSITLGVVLIGFVAEALFAPKSDGVEGYRFAGTLHPNHAALNASYLVLCSLYLAHRRADRRFFALAAFGFFMVILCKSRTALAGIVVGAALFMLIVRPIRQRFAMVLISAAVIGATLFLVFTDSLPHLGDALLLNRAKSDPTTLTGRTVIWQFVWSYLSTDWGRILAGFGFGGFWNEQTAKSLSETAHFKLAESHNDYLELIVQLGFVGLFLYIWGQIVVLWKCSARVRRNGSLDAALLIAVVAFTLVHSIAESAMTLPVYTTMVAWALIGSIAITGLDDPPAQGVR